MKAYSRLALLTFVTTMLLVIWGGVVHNTGASLACPDWPTCYGSLLPKMEGLVAVEHGHRLLATLVGLFSIGLFVLALRQQPRDQILLRVSAFALGLVVLQGLLGGLTVIFQLPDFVSTAHLGASQLFIATLLFLLMRSRHFLRPQRYAPYPPEGLLRGNTAALLLVFAQMLLGAFVRHSGSGAACGVGWENAAVCLDLASNSPSWWPTAGPSLLHSLHRSIALLTGVGIFVSSLPILRWAQQHGHRRVLLLCVLSYVLWALQVFLGVLSVAKGLALVPVTLHLLGAMLLWLSLLGLNFSLRNFKLNHILRI